MRKPLNCLIFAFMALLMGCGGSRLSSEQARKQIANINNANILPEAIQVRRVVAMGEREAIAEATATLAFQFKRANKEAPWRITAIRLGDNDWLDFDEVVNAVNDARRRATLESIGKLSAGVESYRRMTGSLPVAADIVKLSDQLYPRYMDKLIRDDAWGRPLRYEASGATFRILSNGPNGAPGDADDVTGAPGA